MSARAPHNPPAFPNKAGIGLYAGMTLRDWFAGQAIAPLATLAGNGDLGVQEGETNGAAIVRNAYELADLMLAERSKA